MSNRRGSHSAYEAPSHRAHVLVTVLVAGLAGALVLSSIGTDAVVGATTPSKVRLGHPPRLPAGATAVSSLPRTTALSVDVVLQPRDPVGLRSYAEAVSTPGASQYRHYLTVQEFVSRFGPTESTIASVKQALASAGLQPGGVGANHLSIPVRATAGQLASAFSTGFTRYRVSGGRIAYANITAPQMSGSVAPYVQTVVGLDDLSLPTPAIRHSTFGGALAKANPHGGTGGPQACSTAVTDARNEDSYTTDQVASAYGFPDLYGQGDLGSGQTVALYELQVFRASDVATYQSCFGTDTPVTTVDVDGGPLAHSGVGEADVDIEQVSGLAPDTHILVYEGPNTDSGGYDTYSSIVSQNEAKVISTSWGECEAFMGSAAAQAENSLFEEAAAQGQTIVAASGDQGSEDCLENGYANDTLAVDDPASQPFVTGAGGTSWSAAGTPPTESAWNDGPTCCWGAGGGGVSSLWAMPSYQTGTQGIGVINAGSSGVPCGAASGSYCREAPDVSALSGPYPYLNYVSGDWGSWGGTSLAAPLWASLIALSNASSACSGEDIRIRQPCALRHGGRGTGGVQRRHRGQQRPDRHERRSLPCPGGLRHGDRARDPQRRAASRSPVLQCGLPHDHCQRSGKPEYRSGRSREPPDPRGRFHRWSEPLVQRRGSSFGSLDRRFRRPDLGYADGQGNLRCIGDGTRRHRREPLRCLLVVDHRGDHQRRQRFGCRR